ncbi:DHH family phosphoesterase [Lacrimispora sp. 210928-DFI.3.58]|uniref:DHH family phosphoesterase n=1 Tax=Lacrimispora sp. 210928-DFI.3.58 TaxID=2883214 RepID=UPI0015B58E3D|nr:DHH family phosphoesterase [Lacrimispora sp. 210928-DFI.3.58]MCB7318020.1 DHH family phosphoesterase [Lacrimispora sp. 210928-DFI.3.58]
MRDKGRVRGTFRTYLQWPLMMSVFMILLTALVAAVSLKAGIIVSVFTLIYIGIALWLYFSRKRGILAGLISFSSAYGQSSQILMEEMLIPYAVTDSSGRLLWMNREFREVLAVDKSAAKNITAIFPEVTKELLATGGEMMSVHTTYGERKFRVDLKEIMLDHMGSAAVEFGVEGKGASVTAVYLIDETQTLKYMQQIHDQKLVAGLIYLDNYDEALESVEEVRRSLLTALIDRKISKYISGMNGIVKKMEKDKYFFVIKQQYMARIQEERFSILEDVKTVNIGNDMAVTLSIGIGMNGDSYSQNYDYARTSIDMALGRGGDQAVVKDADKIQYYGGKAQQMEKTTRVKARVKAHALRELMENKDRLLIMGHRLADIDSFGAAIGIYRIAMSMNKKANIVVNEVTSSVRPMMDRFIGNGEYPEDMFLKGPQAQELVDPGTMLVVVDVNRPSITDEPSLLRMVKTIVVLDHHRTSSEIIDNAVLSYVEPYASSACEMVAEVLQYIADGIRVRPAEADAMYAGIVIDTQNFTNQTGVRTFEAAAFLRRNGADITRVRKLFRENMRDYQAKAEAVRAAEVYMDAFAISVCPAEGLDSPTIIGAQAANELLEIRGIKASVVLTDYNGTIYFSARSIDEVNVQVMMEKLGGGGHRTIAGAQMQKVSIEEAKERLKEVIRQMVEEGQVS